MIHSKIFNIKQISPSQYEIVLQQIVLCSNRYYIHVAQNPPSSYFYLQDKAVAIVQIPMVSLSKIKNIFRLHWNGPKCSHPEIWLEVEQLSLCFRVRISACCSTTQRTEMTAFNWLHINYDSDFRLKFNWHWHINCDSNFHFKSQFKRQTLVSTQVLMYCSQ